MRYSKGTFSPMIESQYNTHSVVRSMDWYAGVAQRQASHEFDEPNSQENSMAEMPRDLVSPNATETNFGSEHVAHPDGDDLLSSRAATPKPSQNNTPPDSTLNIQPEAHEDFGSLPSASNLMDDGRDLTTERSTPGSAAFVVDAADNLLNAMTKMMNSHRRRTSLQSDEGIDMESDVLQLSHPQRQMLQKILSTALERLSETSTVSEVCDDKQDWFQCDVCSKRTRLRCEMK